MIKSNQIIVREKHQLFNQLLSKKDNGLLDYKYLISLESDIEARKSIESWKLRSDVVSFWKFLENRQSVENEADKFNLLLKLFMYRADKNVHINSFQLYSPVFYDFMIICSAN
jgi:hypothetical protein